MSIKPITLGKTGTNFFIKAGENIAGPQQRLVAGVAALATQPLIDLNNKDVDEQTRKYSVARTVVKIIVGTTVGVTVRHFSIKAAKHLSDEIIKPLKRLKTPEEKILFTKTLGDTLGLIACFFTNFIIDAPLTKYGMNYLTKKYHLEDSKSKD